MPTSCAMLGRAVSGQAVMHSMHCVHFAAGDVLGLGRTRAGAHHAERRERAGGLMITEAVAELGIELGQRLEGVPRRLLGGHGNAGAAGRAATGRGNHGSCSCGATGGLRIEERSGSLNSPYLISCTRENPSFITVMFEVTTSSPNRPNFFWYC